MKPLIIIATPNICWLTPSVPYPRTATEIAQEAKLCRENGASVLHAHGEGQWVGMMAEVRKRSDILIQCGMSSIPLRDRMDVMNQKADMISIILNHHDEAFAEVDCNMLHTKPELEEYAAACRTYGVKPEFLGLAFGLHLELEPPDRKEPAGSAVCDHDVLRMAWRHVVPSHCGGVSL